MSEQFISWDEAVASLAATVPPLLFVEGAANVGKSPFAKAVARSIGALVLSTDCLIRAGGAETPYPEMVDRDALNLLIGRARRPLIVEGICLREIVDPSAFEGAFTIYLRRVLDDGTWPLAAEVAEFIRSKWPLCIEVEVLDYHKRIAPQDAANATLTLNELDRP